MKEENKCYCGHTTYCDCGPETLEEAAETELRKQNWDTTITLPFNGGFIEGFQQGAKWQQEQILDFLYSEITERRDYSASKMCEKVIEFIKQNK